MTNFNLNHIVINENNQSKKIVILLHGYGADASDLVPIGEFFNTNIQNSTTYLPNAFDESEAGIGRQWFSLQSWNMKDWKNDIKLALTRFNIYLDNLLLLHNLTTKDVLISGFSQGAMMALQIGLERSLGAIISFSGAFINDGVLNVVESIPPVLMIHGEADSVLSVNCLKEAEDAFLNKNFKIDAHIIPRMEHSIDMRCLDIAKIFIKNNFT